MLTAKQAKVVDLRDRQGKTFDAIAKELKQARSTVHDTYQRARKKLDAKSARLSPDVQRVLGNLDLASLPGQHSGWVHREDEKTGEWASVYFFLGKDGEQQKVDLEELAASAIEGAVKGKRLARRARPKPNGDNLLVIDIADLHIGKLAVKAETGFEYNREIAIERGVEGTRRLLEKAQKHGVAHILFVLGNDIIHIDKPSGATTAGTSQDTDGTIHVMWDDAHMFYQAAIDLCRQVAPVSLIYCPSNHDWFAGFTVARSLRAYYRNCPEVSASLYNTSPIHRKYFAFGNNLIGLTHADGAKEADLPQLMVDEAADLLATCKRRYWYLHHLHHKIKKTGRGTARRLTEKDLIGMTIIAGKAGLDTTDAPEIEYVRSPSAPDGWHHRNGYVNLQAVECFMHDPHEGQDTRFTAWF